MGPRAEQLLTIGEVARHADIAPSALRYYDDLGLVRPTARVSGQRRYRLDAVVGVRLIKIFREAGFTLAEIKQLIGSRAKSPRAWRSLAERKLTELDVQIARTEVARLAIQHALDCPKQDVLVCPNFWTVVGGVWGGRSLGEALEEVHPRQPG
ncbi:MAG: MerR family transcriptional regulator [Actinomycetota bacterium]